MKNTVSRWLKSGLVLLLVLCTVLSVPAMAAAAEKTVKDEYCPAQRAVQAGPLAKKGVDMIVSYAIDSDISWAFSGRQTNAKLKSKIIMPVIESKIEENAELLTKFGLENNAANRKLMADELWEVACIYYENKSNRDVAEKKAMLEVLRFVLIQVEGCPEEKAPAMAEEYYEIYQIYICRDKDDSTNDSAAAYAYAEQLLDVPHDKTEWVEEKPATCSAKGTKGHYKCICGRKFQDQIGKQWISNSDLVLPSGHIKVTHEAKAATCEEIGWKAYETCSREGCTYTTYKEIKALGHSVVKHEAQAATCRVIGWDEYETCGREGCTYTTYEEIAALGHDMVLTSAGQAATCEQDGWKAYETCSRCTYNTYEGIPALGHDIVKYEAKEATCNTIGWNAYEACVRCDYSTYEEIAKLAHSEEIIPGEAATCTKAGLTDGVQCSVCEEILKVQDVIPAFGHSYGEGVVAKAATCTENGEIAYICANDASHVKTEILVAYGHKDADQDDICDTCGGTLCKEHQAEEIPGVAATCEKDGLTTGQRCANCGSILLAQDVIPATGHDYVSEITSAATCTTAGVVTYTCAYDVAHSYTEQIAALSHDVKAYEAKAATCTEAGWDAYDKCTRCDYSTYHERAALGHELTEYAGKAATCLEDGWKAYEVCSRCDHNTYEKIGALDHDIVKHDAKAATCTEAGWEAYEACSRCDYSTYKQIAALNHEIVKYEAKAATCTEAGWEAYEACSRCSYSTYKQIAALNHDIVKHDAKAATCTEAGWNAYESCSRCNYSTYVQIDAPGHDIVNHEGKAATCTEAGWNAYETCNRCDRNTYVEIAALDHAWSEVITKEADCENPGEKTYVCANDASHNFTEAIPATGHEYEWGKCTHCGERKNGLGGGLDLGGLDFDLGLDNLFDFDFDLGLDDLFNFDFDFGFDDLFNFDFDFGDLFDFDFDFGW